MATGDFDSGQSSFEYGQSLLADKEMRDKKTRKRQKKIKNVSYLLGAVGVADMFLANKAKRKLEDFSINLTAEKATELHNLTKATSFKTDVLNTLGKHIDWSDPNTWVEGGAAHTALAEQLGDLKKGGLTPRSSYSTQQFDSDEEKQYRDQLYQAVLDDGSFAGLKKRYDEHKGIIDSSTTLINSKYKDILSKTTKEFMSPQNTSSIRKILGRLGLVDKDLDKLDKGEYVAKSKKQEELKVIEEAIIQNSNNYVKSRKESFDTMTTGGKRLVITDLQKYNATEDKALNGILTGKEDPISLTGKGGKEGNDIATLIDKFNSYDISVPLPNEGEISLGNLFRELTTTEQTHFIKNLKALVTRQLKTKDDEYKKQGITDLRAYVTDEMVQELLNKNISDPEKGMIIVKTEETKGLWGLGFLAGQTRNYTIKDYGTFTGEKEDKRTYEDKFGFLQRAINLNKPDVVKKAHTALSKEFPDKVDEFNPVFYSYLESINNNQVKSEQPMIPSEIPEGYELHKEKPSWSDPYSAEKDITKKGQDQLSIAIKGADKGVKWWNAQTIENRVNALQKAVDTGKYGAVGSILAKEAGGYKELKQLNQSEKRSLARQIILKLRG